MRIACAVLLFKDGFAQKRLGMALPESVQKRIQRFKHFLRSDSKVQTFPAVSSALFAAGFKDTALHHFIHGSFHAA